MSMQDRYFCIRVVSDSVQLLTNDNIAAAAAAIITKAINSNSDRPKLVASLATYL